MQILVLMLSNHPPQTGSERLPSCRLDHLFCTGHKNIWRSMKTKQLPRNPWCHEDFSTTKLLCKALWSTMSCVTRVVIISGFFLLPAAPAMCSSTLSSSSHAAGWMSPYISSVRTGAALIRSDKGAGERLITCEKTSHALQLSCVISANWHVVFYHICEFKKYFKIYFIFLYPWFWCMYHYGKPEMQTVI